MRAGERAYMLKDSFHQGCRFDRAGKEGLGDPSPGSMPCLSLTLFLINYFQHKALQRREAPVLTITGELLSHPAHPPATEQRSRAPFPQAGPNEGILVTSLWASPLHEEKAQPPFQLSDFKHQVTDPCFTVSEHRAELWDRLYSPKLRVTGQGEA